MIAAVDAVVTEPKFVSEFESMSIVEFRNASDVSVLQSSRLTWTRLVKTVEKVSIELSQRDPGFGGRWQMRVGIFGGSFDPVHFGHLWMAELSREAMQLDEILFVPTATSPLKPYGPVANNEQRIAMLRLAVSGYSPLRVDTREIDRGGISYTIDTVRSLQAERPGDEFFLLVGSDAFRSIDRWKEPQRLLSMITPIVLSRGGDLQMDWSLVETLAGPSRAGEIRGCAIRLPLIEVSSAELRMRVAEGRSIRFRVPRPVEAFIEAEKVYRSPT